MLCGVAQSLTFSTNKIIYRYSAHTVSTVKIESDIRIGGKVWSVRMHSSYVKIKKSQSYVEETKLNEGSATNEKTSLVGNKLQS
jgi:hypothetical protein